jgi:predicted helicase
LIGRLPKKFAFLSARSVGDKAGTLALHTPVPPNFYFAPAATGQDIELEYHRLPELPAVFGTGDRQSDKEVYWATGFASQQDDFAMSFTREQVEEKMATLAASRTFDELQQTYRLCTTDQWDYSQAKLFARREPWHKHVAQVAYRPFDRRWTVLHKHVLTILRKQVMSQLSRKDRNLGLISSRAVNDLQFAHCFVTCEPVDKIFISSKTSTNAYVFPLFFKDDDMYEQKPRPNFSRKFLELLAQTLGVRKSGEHGIPEGITAAAIFHYAYGVFHSPGYRKRYAEFLKIDFPRLPLTGNMELFRALAHLGGELVALHLLESPKLDTPITELIGGRNPEVGKVSWSKDTVWLDKAQNTGFKGVREDVWNFHIGGYQVCEKWLKDRKGRNLSADDRAHYQKIVVALSETIRLMAEIDNLIDKHGGWPLR